MHLGIKLLKTISSRYAPSRMLSFTSSHVFKTLQLLGKYGIISRKILMTELGLGEGSIKTLIRHLKMEQMITTTNKGTKISEKGKNVLDQINAYIYSEIPIPKCTISLGMYNYAVLLRGLRYAIRQGIEQRDIAIKMGARGATTLCYQNTKFLIPGTDFDALKEEKEIENILRNNLNPQEDDVIIIGSDDSNPVLAELAAKGAALYTIESIEINHELRLPVQ